MFNNLRELILSMPTEQDCRDYLVKQRWNDKPVCPYCGHEKSYRIENGKRFKCASKACFKKYSVTVGTVFEDSNIGLVKWFTAIYLLGSHKKGISSHQLAKDIGCTQRTAWFMLHRIRTMLNQPLPKKLDNIIEADETFIGGSISNKHYKVRKEFSENKGDWMTNKTTTLGVLERGGNLILTHIKASGQSEQVIRNNVAFAANIVTDEANKFKPLKDEYYHYSINHSKNEFKRLHFHTNSIEGVFSHLSRMIFGIYHHVTAKHLQRYLNEFTFRFNNREMKDPTRFNLALSKTEGRLTYAVLVQKEQPKEVKPKSLRKWESFCKPVYQIKDGEIIAQFDSIAKAAKLTSTQYASIQRALKNPNRKAGGYNWSFVS